jgi:uncharacterized protein YjgD (DUF1641 family)
MLSRDDGLDDLEVEALKELLEIMAYLKKSGALEAVKRLAVELTEARAFDVAEGVVRALGRLDPPRISGLEASLEDSSYCLYRALSETRPAEVRGRGLLGLLAALRNPDVQRGLGFLLALAEGVGRCLRGLGRPEEE